MATDLRLADARTLDLTLPTLSLDQVAEMGELALSGPDRTAARIAAINGCADDRLLARWCRWSAVFGLPRPVASRPTPEILLHPYAAVGRPHRRLAGYLTGVLAVFDAGLATVCQDSDIAALLAAPWSGACLPTAVTPDTEFGPHTPAVRTALAQPQPPVLTDERWREACDAVEDTAVTWGVPFLPRHLRAEAELAWPVRADAAWGAAVCAALADRLPSRVRSVLTGA